MRRWAPVLMLVGILSTAGWLVTTHVRQLLPDTQTDEWSPNVSQNLAILAGQSQLSEAHQPWRPVYRYSVVPGGVKSVEELREAVAHDREVAAHYTGFQYDRAKLVRLQRAQMAYLSYRVNGKVYWTRTPHLIPAGETLITDGEMTARTRCANRISLRKQLAISPKEEPPAEALEQIMPPVLPPSHVRLPDKYETAALTGPGREALGRPNTQGPWLVFPPPLPINVRHRLGGGCESASEEQHEHQLGMHDDESKEVACPPRGPSAATPEPGTIVLLTSGLAALLLFYQKRKRSTAAGSSHT